MNQDAVDRAVELYQCLAEGDRAGLDRLLHPDFEGRTTAGLPLGLGGVYHGPKAMRKAFWGKIAQHFAARAEPAGFTALDGGRLMVTGRYTGTARVGGGVLDAEFVHILSFSGDRIIGLVQMTDSARWRAALGEPVHRELGSVRLTVEAAVARITLDRPGHRNAIDLALAEELCEVAQRCADRDDIRAVLISGAGPAFTVGGDIELFAATDPAELPDLLRRMVTPYHESLRLLNALEVPVVAAVHGAVAGGGLGLLYSADIALAAAGTKFATGFAALGLSGDGGNSWFLPRLVGMRRATELYFRNRVLTADEALDWGLVSEVVPPEALEGRALEVARALADGPTRAFGEVRRLLRDSWSTSLPEQLTAEIDALSRTARTTDTARAVHGFVNKTAPKFEGN
ncbi:enoyl-CoA hydratase-related protein [Nocardia sp. NPDC059246]|uniref:enoyl-CoA hydratase-related protein n=1 Tax=unclassified Nocardia TaxID=2637762 RepID=UPI00368BC610